MKDLWRFLQRYPDWYVRFEYDVDQSVMFPEGRQMFDIYFIREDGRAPSYFIGIGGDDPQAYPSDEEFAEAMRGIDQQMAERGIKPKEIANA